MTKFWDWFCDYGFIWFLLLLFMAAMTFIVRTEGARRELERNQAKTCYSQGMIVATTSAGSYCVDPRSMMELKDE